ncbi:MAG: phytanoyl-CoA dioxygenase family protein [Chloroflexi bacterium]|nr:phytanoyl-CoA dioxygenase family protein [Chloroflexota bacterium]
MSSSNRAQLMRDGYLVKRDVIPEDQLASLRVTFETLLDRQRAVWRRERGPDDPPGGIWDSAMQPRLSNTETFIDADTAEAVEIWVSEPIRGLAAELLDDEHAGISAMQMMCNPTFDYGPAPWHRDIHPIDMGPMQSMQDSLVEDGPNYMQWNIPLYDDSVFWIVPGSHTRINTEAENRSLLENARVPIPGGEQVELRAGDVLVYVNYLIHWGSRYMSEPTRRTLHGGHTIYPHWEDLDFTQHLSAEARGWFELWAARTARLKDDTERALRAVLDRDGDSYSKALEALRPGAGAATKLQLTIWLCKAAMHIHNLKRPDYASLPAEFRRRAEYSHGISLNWGPAFAERFTKPEADAIWQRFGALEDHLLAPGGEDYVPGYQSGPIPYSLERMHAGITVGEFIASWGHAA